MLLRLQLHHNIKFTKHPLSIISILNWSSHHGEVKSQQKINGTRLLRTKLPIPILLLVPVCHLSPVISCSHPGRMADNVVNKNNKDVISLNSCGSMKASSHCPRQPDSDSTSLCIATKGPGQELIFALPKIPKKKGKADGGGGSANVNLGGEDCGYGDVSGSSDGSVVMDATSWGRAKGENFFYEFYYSYHFFKHSDLSIDLMVCPYFFNIFRVNCYIFP